MTNPAEDSGLHRIARIPFLPALTHIDARFAALFARLQSLEDHLQQRMVQDLPQRQDAQLNQWGAQLTRQFADLADRVHADAQAVMQTGAFVERASEALAGIAGTDTPPAAAPTGASQRAALLQLLAHDGPVAQAGLWFNPPVVLRSSARGFELDQVHERIVEIPFVFRCLAGVPAGGAVLDVGCAESTVAFSLAALGYRTTALDPRGYPLSHPNLQVVTANIARWPGPGDGTLDAIVCLSTLEHLGLKAYGVEGENPDLDRETMARFRTWLRPGGLLVLTVPYGRPAVTDFERTYGPEQLDELLATWTVTERVVLARTGSALWSPHAEAAGDWPEQLRGVALVAAHLT
ncbi:MAG: class I SAM-dependent methyltransferase [Lentisphaerae bacterium]|nr:class I SAM-dependent methyltransferase [Lentisphaerota bacterium]